MFFETIESLLKSSEGMSRPVYRGQANAEWEVNSGVVRRIANAYESEYVQDDQQLLGLIRVYQQQELIEPLKLMGHLDQSDESMLVELQHHGAATQLVDFTENPLVALWFACCDPEEGKEGKVFVTDIGNSSVWINGRDRKWLSEEVREYLYYEPDRSSGARISAQSSIFLVGNPHIPKEIMQSIPVPADEKRNALEQLERLKISERVLFADLPGLATLNSANRKLKTKQHTDPNTYKRLGRHAFRSKNYIEALANFTEYVNSAPTIAEPYWLQGNAFAELKNYDKAIDRYDEAIALKKKPLPTESVIWEEWFLDYNLGTYFFNRGNTYAALDKHEKAINDFDETVKLVNGLPNKFSKHILRDAHYNKANSHFALGQFEEAYEHFKSSDWNEQSGANLGMGNSALMQAKFKEALNCYRAGIGQKAQVGSSCRSNFNALTELLMRIGKKKIVSCKTEDQNIRISVRNVNEASFRFAGNMGNVGNWGGGESYSDLGGFEVNLMSK